MPALLPDNPVMALFPDCRIKVELPNGRAVAGERLEGTIVLDAPEEISRAERVQIAFITSAWAGYGSGKSRSVRRATLFHAPLELALGGSLAAGIQDVTFEVDVPRWLPPAYQGSDCAIEHAITVRVDVDWAVDPKRSFSPPVVPMAKCARCAPFTVRSPPSFHDQIILEVALASTTVVQGGKLEGSVALRSGHGATFDAVALSLEGYATIVMGRGDRRLGHESHLRIDAARLRDGGNVPFAFRIKGMPPGFRNGFIDHDVALGVTLDIPWARDPSFQIPLKILPLGSAVEGEAPATLIGSDRMRLIAESIAHATGLAEASHPKLVEGKRGTVSVSVSDSPRGSRLGLDLDLEFPSVDLGLELRPERLLDFGGSPLLSGALAKRFVLRRHPEADAPQVADAAVARFVDAVTHGLEGAIELRMSDHHVGAHLEIEEDEVAHYVALARLALQKASDIAAAIVDPERGLPFPAGLGDAGVGWRVLASEHEAALVPSRPAIHGLTLAARIIGGDERFLRASLRALWTEDRPRGVRWDVDLSRAPLTEKARATLESLASGEETATSARGRALLARFPSIQVHGRESVSLEANGWHDDPRAWMPDLEALFAWVLEARGERRADSPYR